jgi:hypothetical protein
MRAGYYPPEARWKTKRKNGAPRFNKILQTVAEAHLAPGLTMPRLSVKSEFGI